MAIHTGKVIKLGDKIDTDIIIPTQYMTIETIEEMKQYGFYPIRNDIPSIVKQGDILVAGRDFGCGSSREQAPEIIKALGFYCVIAQSFARIFYRNAINNGLLLIENSEIYDQVQEGDTLSVDLENTCLLSADNKKTAFGKIPGLLRNMISHGGLVNYYKEINAKTEQSSASPESNCNLNKVKMKHTLFEKIILNHCKEDEIKTGDIVEVTIDRMMVHDFFTPFFINKFKEMGFKKVCDPDKLIFIYDHLVPTSFTGDYRHHKAGDDFARDFGLQHVHRSDGICHQLMHEQGYVKPGDIVLGTDSHTVTYGAIGALATGIGYTEMAAVAGTGKTWMKVVPSIKVVVTGGLTSGVTSKDIILKLLGDIKSDGASYKIIEFTGDGITNLSIDSRLTLSNMVVEAGAKAGLIAPDEKTVQYLDKFYSPDQLNMLKSDPGAAYEKEITYNAKELVPLVACPHNVDNVVPAAALNDTAIVQAFLGSCTNGRTGDLALAARIMKGKKVHPHVRFLITPASRDVYKAALAAGYIETLVEAGGIVNHPACGLCAGRAGGILEDGERVISTNNRNFIGRMGGKDAGIYLASPATVAASAIEGRITDPVKYL